MKTFLLLTLTVKTCTSRLCDWASGRRSPHATRGRARRRVSCVVTGSFYKPDGDDTGTLGLPISVPGRAGYKHLFQDSAAILFLRNNGLHFEEIGELGAQSEKAVDDSCRASCVDWYGNSRPLFIRNRVFALLGYEIVEGRIANGAISETRRTSFSPR